MADTTSIEWTDATWNPITGCSVHSPGCTNCYAMKLAGTRMKHHWSREGLTIDTKAGPVWNGEVRFNAQWLDQPLRWKKPRMIFVCAHADLFHENVPDEWIDRIFAVMALCPQHTFQVLTKRADRMRDYVNAISDQQRERPYDLDYQLGDHGDLLATDGASRIDVTTWPLPNVWLGVSVEDEKRADERIPDLLATPAAVRWLSCEPLLGPVNLRWALSHRLDIAAGFLERGQFSPGLETLHRLDWIVAGGESGPNARPMHPDWARSLRDQCAAVGVPFLFKQWGESCPLRPELIPVPWKDIGWVAKDGRYQYGCTEDEHQPMYDDDDRFGPGYWMQTVRVGKKAAGRLLDGVEHNGFPA